MAVFWLGDTSVIAVFVLLAILLAGFAAVRVTIFRQEERVARCLTLAERDFNNLVNGGMSHGGRKERIAERREWNEMARLPVIEVNAPGYRSIAHDLVEWNEKDANGKGATMGKAAITAFLLRELYQADVEAAQIKIFADTRNNGTPPYIAPGVYELVGFDRFDNQHGFPAGAGVERWLLRRVVRKWGFPRNIRMIRTDESGASTFREPMDALAQLFQQNL